VVVLIQIAASITAAYHAGALEADFNGVSIAVERMVPETFDPEVRLRRPSVGQCLNRVPEVGEDSAQVVRCEQPFEAQVLSTGRPCPKTSDLDPDHQANTEIVSRKFGSLILCFAVGRGRELMSEPACVGELACTL
jgi:hypothetical protein